MLFLTGPPSGTKLATRRDIMMSTFRCLRVVVLLAGVLAAVSGQAASVTLAWDPNPESDVAGYRVYYGTPAGQFGTVIGGIASTNQVIPDLQAGATYSFYVTCYNTSGLESEPSNVVDYTVPLGNNQAPVAISLSVRVTAGTTNAIQLTGTDPEGATLSFALVEQPSFGLLATYPPAVTYVAPIGYVGPDSFAFTVNDGFLDSEPATVAIDVVPANQAPTATAQSVAVDEDAAVGVALQASDPEGGILSFRIATAPEHGTLTGTPPSVTYRPATNYSGPDRFTFTAGDGELTSTAAVVSLTVRPVNDAPTAAAGSVSVVAGSSVGVRLAGADLESDPLSFAVVTGPLHGVLSGVAPDLTYTPAAGYSGADSFSFVARDATLTSAAATVSVSVSPAAVANQPPVVNAGVDQTVLRFTRSSLRGTVSDDRLPAVPGAVSVTWSVASGPSGASITSPRSLTTKVRFTQGGRYVFRLTATDGELSASDEVSVQVGTLAAPSEGSPFTLCLEAEAGALVAPMTVVTNAPVAGAEAIVYAETHSANTGSLSLSFEVPAEGEYVAWCRVRSTSEGADSFYVSMDGDVAAEDIFDTAAEGYGDGWVWTPLCGRGGATNGVEFAYAVTPRVFQLAAGAHFLTFRGRESSTPVDAVVITSDPAFDPAEAELSTEPAVVSLQVTQSGPVAVTWSAIPGRRYQVLHKESLEAPWTAVSGDLRAATTTGQWTLPGVEGGCGFFTVVLVP